MEWQDIMYDTITNTGNQEKLRAQALEDRFRAEQIAEEQRKLAENAQIRNYLVQRPWEQGGERAIQASQQPEMIAQDRPQVTQQQMFQQAPNPQYMTPEQIQSTAADKARESMSPEALENAALMREFQSGTPARPQMSGPEAKSELQQRKIAEQNKLNQLMKGQQPTINQPVPQQAPQQAQGQQAPMQQPVPRPQMPQQTPTNKPLPYNARNYAELQAMNMQAKQITDLTSPSLEAAYNTQNKDAIKTVASIYRDTNNPMLVKTADMLDSIKFTEKGTVATIDLSDPNAKKSFFEQNKPFYKSIGINDPAMIADGNYDFTFDKNPNTGQFYPTAVKRTDKQQNPMVKSMLIDDQGHYGTFERNPKTGEWTMLQEGKKPTSASYYGKLITPELVASVGKAVQEGRMPINLVGAYGGLRGMVTDWVERNPRVPGETTHYAGDIAKQKAGTSSQTFITKQLDASESFITTIDNNIALLNEHIDKFAERHNMDRARVLNMGTRAFNEQVRGDSDFNIYDMLVGAISIENAKLQAGGAGSVAQVAQGAAERMHNIHDKNLPLSEMVKLIGATRQEGGNRIKALQDQLTKATGRTATVNVAKESLKPKNKGQALPEATAMKYYTATDKSKTKEQRKKEAMEAAIADGWVVK